MEAGNSSSSYSVVGGQEHEVFLNFRGKDCRTGLTDHLYQGLIRAGVRVFRDNEKLHIGGEIGEELIRGIKESAIYIPIFSKNYAESKWCLREFALMMECRKELKRTVLPIFCDVSPDDVQHQRTDIYVEAFAEHVSKVGAETVDKWKDALTQVGSLKGWNLQNEFNGHEGELVNAVVAEVKKRLKKDHIHTQGKFVGADDKIKQVMQLVNFDVRIIGIWGMGGIGKTTLANAIYNKLLDQFDCCGFLESVRAKASTYDGLKSLLEILIRKLSRSERQHIDTVSEGRKQLSERFRAKKVLIFLDDVDKKEHLEALALADDRKDSWFAKGSLVIVTTRDSGIFLGYSGVKIYPLEGMEKHHALQVFCNRAFQAESPTPQLQELSEDIVKTTGGLPLALNVIGSSLYAQEEQVWVSTLEKLQLMKPYNDSIKASLRISYEALSNYQKDIFLDIACFYIGEDTRNASYIWKDRFGYSPTCELNILCSMSLIRIQPDFTIWMHDQLRDLGREIVETEACELLGKRTIFWRSDKFKDFLMEREGSVSSNVEAICLDGAQDDDYGSIPMLFSRPILPNPANCVEEVFTDEDFRAVPNLRLLKLNGVTVAAGDFKQLLPNLRWFSWKVSSFMDRPPNLNPSNLIVLQLTGSWNRIGLRPLFRYVLNTLDLLPTFIFPTSLHAKCDTYLDIAGDLQLVFTIWTWVHPPTAPTSSLIIMEETMPLLELCTYWVQKFWMGSPRQRLNLKTIRWLHQKLPPLVWTLVIIIASSLLLLNLWLSWTQDDQASTSMQLLLTIIRWLRWKILPILMYMILLLLGLCVRWIRDMWIFSSMQRWTLTTLRWLYLSPFLWTLMNLIALSLLVLNLWVSQIHDDWISSSMQGHLITLRWLRWKIPLFLSTLMNLIALKLLLFTLWVCLFEDDWISSSMQGWMKLKVLYLSNCHHLTQTPDFSSFKKLERLTLKECYSLKMIDASIGKLESLVYLNIEYCPSLEELPDLPVSLINLAISCPSVILIRNLPDLINLRELNFHSCDEMVEIPEGIKKLKKLLKLSIKDCSRLKSIAGLPTNLNELDVDGCKYLEEIQGLTEVLSLTKLSVKFNKHFMGDYLQPGKIERLDLSKLKKLQRVNIDYCNLVKIQGLACSLTDLRITNCNSLKELLDLSNLESLKHLAVNNCDNLQGLQGIDALESLEVLNISQCDKIKQLLPNLSNLKCLREMNANGCWELQSLEGLDRLEALQELNIERCAEIRLLNLTNVSGLQKLNARHCRKLQCLEGLDGLEALEELDIGGCHEIKHLLPNLSKLSRLQKLDASECEKLQGLEGLDELEALKKLYIKGCKSIDQLLDLSNLIGLQKLDAYGCEKLQGLEGLDGLKALEELNIGGCKGINQLLPKISNLTRLRKLNAHACEKLTGFESLDGLEELDIGGHKEIKLLPYLSNFTCLKKLNVYGCEKLQSLEGLDGLKRLEELNIGGCKEIKLLPNLSNLTRLRKLNVYKCEKLQSLEGLDGLKGLGELNIGCNEIKQLPNLSSLTRLRKLNVYKCEKLHSLEGLDGLKGLGELNIGCNVIKQLPNLSSLTRLWKLNVYECEKLQSLEGLDGLKGLGELNIGGCKEIKQLPDLSSLTHLWILNAYECEKLQSLEGLNGLKELRQLVIGGCKAIRQLPNLSNLKSLQELNACRCEKLQDLHGLDGLEGLRELNIGGCKEIKRLPNLSRLTHLWILNVSECEKLQSLEGVDGLKELRQLVIGGCKAIRQLPNLSNLIDLRELNAYGCEKLQGVEGLDGLKALEKLSIEGCKAIRQLPNLSSLKRLWKLNLYECEKLQTLEGLDGLKRLRELNIEGCKAIRELPNLSDLKSLRKLNACSCEKLQGLHGLDGLKELEELNIEGCKAIRQYL